MTQHKTNHRSQNHKPLTLPTFLMNIPTHAQLHKSRKMVCAKPDNNFIKGSISQTLKWFQITLQEKGGKNGILNVITTTFFKLFQYSTNCISS